MTKSTGAGGGAAAEHSRKTSTRTNSRPAISLCKHSLSLVSTKLQHEAMELIMQKTYCTKIERNRYQLKITIYKYIFTIRYQNEKHGKLFSTCSVGAPYIAHCCSYSNYTRLNPRSENLDSGHL